MGMKRQMCKCTENDLKATKPTCLSQMLISIDRLALCSQTTGATMCLLPTERLTPGRTELPLLIE